MPRLERERQEASALLSLAELDADPARSRRELRAICAVVDALLTSYTTDDDRQAVETALQALDAHRLGVATSEATEAALRPLLGIFAALLRSVTFARLLQAQQQARLALEAERTTA